MPPVIFIGAGIVGVCAAAWLQRAGRQVLLIDQGDPGMGASFGNGKRNLAGMTPGPETAPDPLTVGAAPQAREIFRALKGEVTARLREARGTPFTSILARIAENAAKLALVRAVAFDPAAPVIRAIDAEWAIRLVRHCADHTMIEVERHVADNPTEATNAWSGSSATPVKQA